MQTDVSVASEESPIVRLKCGEIVSRFQYKRVLDLKQEENGAILFNDLVLRCRDDAEGFSVQYVYFDGSLRRLRELGFLDDDDEVPASIRAIALSIAD